MSSNPADIHVRANSSGQDFTGLLQLGRQLCGKLDRGIYILLLWIVLSSALEQACLLYWSEEAIKVIENLTSQDQNIYDLLYGSSLCLLLLLSPRVTAQVTANAKSHLTRLCEVNIRLLINRHVMGQDSSYIAEQSPTEIQHITNMSSHLVDIFESISFDIILQGIRLGCYIVWLRQETGILPVTVAVVGLLTGTVFSQLMSHDILEQRKTYNDNFYAVLRTQETMMQYHEYILVNNLNNSEEARFSESVKELYKNQNSYFELHMYSDLVKEATSLLAIGIPLVLVVIDPENLSGTGRLFIVGSILLKVGTEGLQFQRSVQRLQQYAVDLQPICSLLNRRSSAQSSPAAQLLTAVDGQISFNEVSYLADQNVLLSTTFTVYPGETVAIVAESGAGKSSIFQLLTRLEGGYNGQILLDGFDIRNLDPVNLRSHIAMMSQKALPLGSSIEDVFRRLHPGATRLQMEDACRLACLHNKAAAIGYDSAFGRDGCNLSGGERQRLAIAIIHFRIILNKVSVVLLDEPTSALDPETATLVLQNMKARLNNRTCLMVTHRVRDASCFDKIICLQNGKITQVGTHAELQKQPGLYAKMCEADGFSL